MTKFHLPKGYYIRNLDSRNWIIAKEMTAKESKREKEYIHGYYPNLSFAFRDAVELFALKANDMKELREFIKQLEELKKHLP